MYVTDTLTRPCRSVLHGVGPYQRSSLSRVAQALVLAEECTDPDAAVLLVQQVSELFGDLTPLGQALANVAVDTDAVRAKLAPIEEAWNELLAAEEFEQLRSVVRGLPTAAAL